MSESNNNNDNSTESELKKAYEYKEAGNKLFKNGEYKQALAQYGKIFLWVNHLDVPNDLLAMQSVGNDDNKTDNNNDNNNNNNTNSKPTPSQVSIARSLKLSANLNICMCYIKLKEYGKGLKYGEAAVLLEPNNVRARFRRGQCYLQLNDTDAAKEDIEFALKQYPTDSEIMSYHKLLQTKIKEQAEKQRQIYSKMFQ